MKRVMLIVSYDGTNYHGWQVQPSAVTIEGVLNEKISELTGESIQVIGASRTDAGVHALGNVAVFDTESRIPGEKFSYALNQRLPEDIVIQRSTEVDGEFHPRHCDCIKTYEYTIINRTFPLPEYRNTAYFYYGPLQIEPMRKAAKAFLGEHDFAGFCSAGAQVQTTVRTIYSLEVMQDLAESKIKIRVTGNGFLYNMVRIIAGTLLEVGKGAISPEDMDGIIASCDRQKAGPTAPAKGLKLLGIEYQEKIV
ncbi:MAG: tRNA pseudouridine(38-40) synthase TruA [Butyribacter sp.]|nr:tRNA pseudouridine(38-40) synthase TruA [bacterium]MDY3855030.1 tRNA pseudouridine(38-40) synthase TruA [Butyribacter sp.]